MPRHYVDPMRLRKRVSAAIDSLPLQCIIFMRKPMLLQSIRDWYRQCRGLNKTFLPFLVGTKFDIFSALDRAEQEEILNQSRKFARAMKSPLVFTSASHGINVLKVGRSSCLHLRATAMLNVVLKVSALSR